jgi:DNA-binding NarL/FixJ family response regulator
MEYPRILLADDQQKIIEAVVQLLKGRYDIIGAVENGEQLVEAEARLDPDLIVLDISMPVLNGIEAALRLKESASMAKVIFLTVHEDRDFVEAAFSAGALGYVLKHRLATDLLPAIREVLRNRVFVSPTVEIERTVATGSTN